MISTRPEQPTDIDALREDEALELSLVAEADGTLVGHIAYSAAGIGDVASGWLLVGSLAVLPEHQGNGIGRALLERCSGVTWPGVPDEYVLCLPFSTEEPVGEIAYHPAFLIGT